MPLEEKVDYLGDLDPNSPGPAEFKSEGDDHFRNLKKALRQSFPGATGPILALGVATGPADAYVLTPARPLVEYRAGMLVAFKVTAANATTAPTLDISSNGAKVIKAVDGGPLVAGDMPAGSYQFLLYDGTAFVQQAPSKAYVDRVVKALKDYTDQLSFSSDFPNQTGNAGKVITTNGTDVSWQLAIPAQNGKAGKVLRTNGTLESWESVLPNVVKFTVSGNWIATSETARLTLTGGGGGSTRQNGYPRSGGFGGGTGIVILRNLVIGQSYTVIVGAGGAAMTSDGAGRSGGDSSFSGPNITAVPTATGGPGGNAGFSTGGTAINCDLVFPGGVPLLVTNVDTGFGGGSYFSPNTPTSSDGIGWGAGGGNTSSVMNIPGTAGKHGVVIIET